MSAEPIERKCPSHEQLSEYFDGECAVQEEIETHVSQCEKCRSYLDSLKNLDHSIKSSVSGSLENDEQIAARISQRVKISLQEEQKYQKRFFLFSPVVWRAGVLLIFGVVIGYLLLNESGQPGKEEQVQQEIQKSALVAASFSSTPVKNETAASADIEYVWKMTESQMTTLVDLLKQYDISRNSLKATSDGWQLICYLSRTESEQIRKSCMDAGFKLVKSNHSAGSSFDKNGKLCCVMKFIK